MRDGANVCEYVVLRLLLDFDAGLDIFLEDGGVVKLPTACKMSSGSLIGPITCQGLAAASPSKDANHVYLLISDVQIPLLIEKFAPHLSASCNSPALNRCAVTRDEVAVNDD